MNAGSAMEKNCLIKDCFDSLTAAQISEFENRLPESFGSSVTTIVAA